MTMLTGDSPLRARLVRFLMECDEALSMRNTGYFNPLFSHSPVKHGVVCSTTLGKVNSKTDVARLTGVL